MLFEYLNKAFGNMSETYAYFSEEVGDRDVTTACFALRHGIGYVTLLYKWLSKNCVEWMLSDRNQDVISNSVFV